MRKDFPSAFPPKSNLSKGRGGREESFKFLGEGEQMGKVDVLDAILYILDAYLEF